MKIGLGLATLIGLGMTIGSGIIEAYNNIQGSLNAIFGG